MKFLIPKNLKEIFLSLFNKKVFAGFVFSFIFFAFLFSPQPAAAQGGFWGTVGGGLGGAIMFLPNLIILATLIFLILVSQGLAYLMGALLNFVLSPDFISFSYTNPGGQAGNPVIAIGLNITKSFVNMGLVIALVYIAFSIALRLNETEAKKALARIIIVALLVNFAPVICGLIVDASNIIMSYFLAGIEKGISGILSSILSSGQSIVNFLLSMFDIKGQMAILTRSVVQVILNFALAFTFFLFAILFIVRYVAIWTLVILSPLAFVAWAVPSAPSNWDWFMVILFPPAFIFSLIKKYWDMWWENLIQWSIIGIPLAFFLYLGMRVNEIMIQFYEGKIIPTPGIAIEPSLMREILPFGVTLIFLYLGFFLALQTTALGTAGIVRGARAALRSASIRGLYSLGRTAKGAWSRAYGAPLTAAAERYRRAREEKETRRMAFARGAEEFFASTRRAATRAWGRRKEIMKEARGAIWKGTKAASKGVFNAIKDTAKVGWAAAIKKKKEKKEQTICPTCKRKIPISSKFCPQCGAQLPKTKVKVEGEGEGEAEITCPNCGSLIPTSATFCPECGEKL